MMQAKDLRFGVNLQQQQQQQRSKDLDTLSVKRLWQKSKLDKKRQGAVAAAAAAAADHEEARVVVSGIKGVVNCK